MATPEELNETIERLDARVRALESAGADPWENQPIPPPPPLYTPQLLPDEDEGFWGEIVTEVGSGEYTFKEEVLTDGTTWTDKTDGRTGTCYEANDVAGIANETDDGTGAIVKIREEYDTGGDLRYVFNHEVEPKGDLDTGTSDSTFDSDATGKGNLVTEVVDGQTLIVRLRQTKCWIRTDEWMYCFFDNLALNRWGDVVAFRDQYNEREDETWGPTWFDLDGNVIDAPTPEVSPA